MLWPSMMRWKFQRRRSGTFMASVCRFTSDSSATSAMLAASTPPNSARVLPCWLKKVPGGVCAAQSTTRPSTENSQAS